MSNVQDFVRDSKVPEGEKVHGVHENLTVMDHLHNSEYSHRLEFNYSLTEGLFIVFDASSVS